jgi:hypothetical protein
MRARLKQALSSLHVVTWPAITAARYTSAGFALIERHAATMKEVDHPKWAVGLGPDQLLRACTGLESLAPACDHGPATWLGLSHLHTLRDVDLCQVSTAAIAAALPRLHTLDVACDSRPAPTAVDGFFEDLLPRLRVFRFRGKWPVENCALVRKTPHTVNLPLHELVWSSRDCEPSVMRGFWGAQPLLLHVPYHMVNACFLDCDADAQCELLTRVRDLSLRWLTDPSHAISVLRAAPQLRKFTASDLSGDFLWQACGEQPRPHLTQRLEGLLHPKLRSIRLKDVDTEPPVGCVTRLQQLLFPRLQSVSICGTLFI